MKKIFLPALLASSVAFPALADMTVRGVVIDTEGEPMIGATVRVPGTPIAVAADIDGSFSIKVPDGARELKFDYVGYEPMTVRLTRGGGDLKVVLQISEQMLQDVVVTQSIARTRKTPVAISTVDGPTIETKLGNQEFPEVLKTTPGVWATKDGGGYGDAKINIRGFKTENLAALVNGIPVNDMEWGGLYWSNWSGLSDVTSSMQTQRGLGAAILSSPSVGGTINITTRTIDAKRGGNIFYGMGNDGMNHIGFSASTGLMDNGWAITLLGSRKWGDGYIQGTRYDAYTWFVNISKRLNDSHQISLTAFGSPQNHWQRNRNNGLTIEGWQDVRDYTSGGNSIYRYNPTFGYDRYGQVRNSNYNVFHKPQISLNHIWQIDHKSSLSTALYLSIANGYGSSGQGRTSAMRSKWYGATNGVLNMEFRNADGTFDYGAIQEMNEASLTGSEMVMAHSINNHTWVGLVSTYKNELAKGLNLLVGVDARYYAGVHQTKISDLYDGAYFIDDDSRLKVLPANNAAAADPNWAYQKLGVGDIIYRDYTGHVAQEGIYAQMEYTGLDDALTAFVAGSVNNTADWRVDRFYYDKEHGTSETVNFWAGNIKGGVNYNIDRHNNVFVNGGYLTRAPFFSGGAFLQATTSNATNPDAVNEKCASVEVGYEFHSPIFTAQLNGYYTRWMDKTTTKGNYMDDGNFYAFNMSGVDARHMGVELSMVFKPVRWLELSGMLSLGDWIWDSNATGYFYNQMGQPLANINTGAVASGIMAPDHLKATLNQKGRKVGGSAQTTGALGIVVRPLKGWRVGLDWTVSARNYSDYQISSSDILPNADINVADPWRIPWGNQLDFSASYDFNIAGLDATLFGNVNNLCDYNYVVDAFTSSGQKGTWQNAYRVFYSFGRTFSLRLKVKF